MNTAFRSIYTLCALALAAGCNPALNPTGPNSESDVLLEPLQLTHGFQRAGEAYFSRDMQWIIFQATTPQSQDYQMYVARLKWDSAHEPRIIGTEPPIRISPIPSWNSCGFFSPDGESLIFASTALSPKPQEDAGGYQRGSGTYRWTMPENSQIFRADGWKGAVAAARDNAVDLAKHPLTNDPAHHAECAYSPDGKWIVYMTKVQGDPELFVMRSDGSRQTRLTFTRGYDGGPFFSPDGKRLVYRSDRKGNNLLQIYTADLVFDREGNITGIAHEKQLTTEEEDARIAASLPKSSPDLSMGAHPGFATRPADGAQSQPATRPGDGAHPADAARTQPATRPGELLRPATRPASGGGGSTVVNWGPYWHPDGRHIAYATSLHGHANYEIYMMRTDGSRKTRITNSPGADILPVFSPDGQWLMWTSTRGAPRASQIWVARFKMPPGS